jgi:hypothetical protein
MQTNERVTNAYHRLLAHFGIDTKRSDPSKWPSEGELMQRTVAQAAPDPSVGTSALRAALELAARDQWAAEAREINVVALLRDRGVSWREIAQHRGLVSAQAAQQRYQRLTRSPEVLIYAFRAVDDAEAAWHGQPCALPPGAFETGTIDFNPAMLRPFSGQTLEVRYGPVDLPVAESYLRAYAMVNGRRIAPTAAVQQELFGG